MENAANTGPKSAQSRQAAASSLGSVPSLLLLGYDDERTRYPECQPQSSCKAIINIRPETEGDGKRISVLTWSNVMKRGKCLPSSSVNFFGKSFRHFVLSSSWTIFSSSAGSSFFEDDGSSISEANESDFRKDLKCSSTFPASTRDLVTKTCLGGGWDPSDS